MCSDDDGLITFQSISCSNLHVSCWASTRPEDVCLPVLLRSDIFGSAGISSAVKRPLREWASLLLSVNKWPLTGISNQPAERWCGHGAGQSCRQAAEKLNRVCDASVHTHSSCWPIRTTNKCCLIVGEISVNEKPQMGVLKSKHSVCKVLFYFDWM